MGQDKARTAVAIIGVGAVLPDAPDAPAFWENIKSGRYSIREVESDRWNPDFYFDSDHQAPDKTYSQIGGWVRDWKWEPLNWKMPIPPKVSDAMDRTQKWAVIATREALQDYGRPIDRDKTAVILGNAMGGEQHYLTALRVQFPEYAELLRQAPSFAALPADTRAQISAQLHDGVDGALPQITEDTMPGELANIVASRVAALFDLHGPSYTADAACASALAAITAAADGLAERAFDTVITGGIDANMGAPTFVKFSKIGALSATGSRPYAEGADGFVMGEGAAVFLMKRLEDAERDGDKVYAVVRGIGGSSDGKGKGITAPNPAGQQIAIRRGWADAGISPADATMMEGHGTSTKVGDVVEVESLTHVFAEHGAAPGTVALGSVKSNIGHLKAASGAVGVLKVAYSLRDRVLPPSLGFTGPNPGIDFTTSPFYVNTELRPWECKSGNTRCAGVSSFGFGGTNFHMVMEEYVPGRIVAERATPVIVSTGSRAPLRGALVMGGSTSEALINRLRDTAKRAGKGQAPPVQPPLQSDVHAPMRVAIDYKNAEELASKATMAIEGIIEDDPGRWRALKGKGIYVGKGAGKVAFLFPGQGSQYVNMLAGLRDEPVVAEVIEEADGIMTPLLGKPLSDYIFVDPNDAVRVAEAKEALKQTEITQPAVLTVDVALTRLLSTFGIEPDMVMGHSLGEYGALVASGMLPFADALDAVSARGAEMARVSVDDNGLMAAVFGPLHKIREILDTIDGYVVVANINAHRQAVIGGATEAVEKAIEACRAADMRTKPLPVSHAFHTRIVAPASDPLRNVLGRLSVQPPEIPIIANLTGDFYPSGPGVIPDIIDILAQQIASPVQFVKGLETLYEAGARIFVQVGPDRALHGFVRDVLGEHSDVNALFTNQPSLGDRVSFNRALCAMWASGMGSFRSVQESPRYETRVATPAPAPPRPSPPAAIAPRPVRPARPTPKTSDDRYMALGHLFAEFLDKGMALHGGQETVVAAPVHTEEVVVSGASLGLPGREKVFDDSNVAALLRGDQFITSIPAGMREKIVAKNITRLVKSATEDARFESINSTSEVIKLAARGGAFDLVEEYGYPADRLGALDICTQMAIAAGLDALRDAGIPLVLRYKTTTRGTLLPDGWSLPESLCDETGVIFASAFPGLDAMVTQSDDHHADLQRRARLVELEQWRDSAAAHHGADDAITVKFDAAIEELRAEIEANAFTFDRRFLFRVLSMGHSQFAEMIGARGPNTQVNTACASMTQAMSIAEDWIRIGRCRRVIVVSADDATSDQLLDWIGSGFLASGAAATDARIEDAALPFDRRRHGMLLGMGAAAAVLESREAAEERAVSPICEVLGTATANSAFHGTRLDVQHISGLMEQLVSKAEQRWGIDRHTFAAETVFLSHETYTPARGGSAQAEIHALRDTFGNDANRILICNTKGYTGHPMGVGFEDVAAIKALETGIVPPLANLKEPDPELGPLNLSKGGQYPIRYALRLAAGFGSQISMTLMRQVPSPSGLRPRPEMLDYRHRVHDRAGHARWLADVSGKPDASVEVVKRTLRVRDTGQPSATKAAPRTVAKPAAPAPPAPPQAPAVDPVATQLLAIVAEKTGYPPDMLELDLDLEADLGIDTVKQAEMFAAIREQYGIERDDNIRLRDFPTLAHTIEFVYTHRPDLRSAAAVATPAPASAPTAPASSEDPVAAQLLAIVAEKTGYPPDMLELDLDLEADLGIDTVKQAEMFAAIREQYGIERDDNIRLRDFPTLAHTIEFVYTHRPELRAAVSAAPAPAPAPIIASGVSPASAASPAPAVSAPTNEDPVAAKLLAIVADKTGYPTDMLELDLDLEADLGIDTVKQAEMFAAIREEYGIERDDDVRLRDFPTLAHTIEFVYSARPDLRPSAAPAPEATAQPAGDAMDPVAIKLLEIVADKTGYPPDMLELDLDLEADLGIDTVKQAEMFAAIREAYGIERDDDIRLRDFPTLEHVIAFVHDHRPDLAGASAEAAAPEAATTSAPVTITGSDEAAAKIPCRVPVAVIRPALDLCKPSGIELAEGSRVVVAVDQGGVSTALIGQLESLGVETLVIDDAPQADELEERLKSWASEGPVHGVYWLPALDDEGPLAELSPEDFAEAIRIRVKLYYTSLRTLYENIGEQGTFLVAGTRLGGRHGYDAQGAIAALGGGVTGVTKAFKRERPDALCKAVDFGVEEPAQVAAHLVAETLSDRGAVEVGYAEGERWFVGLQAHNLPEDAGLATFDDDSVFVITGAAGSIVSAITTDLAAATGGGTYYLLDLTEEPDASNPDLARLHTDLDQLKRDLHQRIADSGTRATPALVNRQLAGLERQAAALSAIDAVRAAGGEVRWRSLDLRDAGAIADVFVEIAEAHGRVDVLVHAAGLEISHILPDKPPSEFDLVFDVKAQGWHNLLHGLGGLPLGAVAVFSSIAGRFGNAGQTDYSAANDLLCKSMSGLRRTRPETRAVALDWTAWAGIGMATRGSIPKMMEVAGIDMLPAEAGIPITRRELLAGDGACEVVVAEALGVLLEELDESGGLDVDAFAARVHGPMSPTVAGLGIDGSLEVRATLDPTEQPFLFDHTIDDWPVLPGVMGIEAFAEAAQVLFPELHIAAVEDVQFLAPFKFYRSKPRTVTVKAVLGADQDGYFADCSLLGSRAIHGSDAEQTTVHFTARVRLVAEVAEEKPRPFAAANGQTRVLAEDIYQLYFHGPAYQVLHSAYRSGDQVVGQMCETLPENHRPSEQPTLMSPRLIELCLQTAGVWEMGTEGRLALPHRIDRIQITREPNGGSGTLHAVVEPTGDDGSFDAAVVDESGSVYLTLSGYRTIAMPGALDADPLKPIQSAMK